MVNNIYIHVPFCGSKCPYCSFASVPYDRQSARSYLRALEKEIQASRRSGVQLSPETIYVGGGTPSIFPETQFGCFTALLRETFNLERCSEWTMEANPDSLTEQKVKAARDAGIDRVSLGVQAIDESTLEASGRKYTASDVKERIDTLLKSGIVNIGADLIAGLPGVTTEAWERTSEWICRAGVQHISVYSLSIEPDCCWGRDGVSMPGDEEAVELLNISSGILERHGFLQYEISNFALPGFECFHNLNFWRGGDYIGFGPSASSRIGLRRQTNIAEVDEYVRRIDSGQSAVSSEETLSPRADAGERFAFALRLSQGVDLQEFVDGIGEGAAARMDDWLRQLAELESEGLVLSSGNRWKLSKRGRYFADRVAQMVI
ncbi:MAG: radical SAM family heme chaperone HemW [Verrucomicrobiota bacterium]